jgi:protein-S-isoprenylcysteine O-methyltransferase Ste14
VREGRPEWWRGARGEWYAAAQVALIALVFLGPRMPPGLPAWPAWLARIAVVVGPALMVAGGGLLLAGMVGLGANLSPLPCPRPGATLVRSGPYRLVRHPMYAGGIALAFGWAIAVRGWLTLAYAAALLVFLDVKSSREERWLVERFPDYAEYRRRVRKLIPFVH